MAEPVDVAGEVEHWFKVQGFKVLTRGTLDGVAVDLVGDINPDICWRGYALAPNSVLAVLAVLAAEQRWLVEEENGRGSTPGGSYVEMAEERLRRALDVP